MVCFALCLISVLNQVFDVSALLDLLFGSPRRKYSIASYISSDDTRFLSLRLAYLRACSFFSCCCAVISASAWDTFSSNGLLTGSNAGMKFLQRTKGRRSFLRLWNNLQENISIPWKFTKSVQVIQNLNLAFFESRGKRFLFLFFAFLNLIISVFQSRKKSINNKVWLRTANLQRATGQ